VVVVVVVVAVVAVAVVVAVVVLVLIVVVEVVVVVVVVVWRSGGSVGLGEKQSRHVWVEHGRDRRGHQGVAALF